MGWLLVLAYIAVATVTGSYMFHKWRAEREDFVEMAPIWGLGGALWPLFWAARLAYFAFRVPSAWLVSLGAKLGSPKK